MYVVEPEVPGGLGERTVMDRSVHPPRVEHLHLEIEDWLGDGVVECFPCFLVTTDLRDALDTSGVTGAAFSDAEVTATPEVAERVPGSLPTFVRLDVVGTAGTDDVALTPDGRLLVTAAALEVLREHGLEQAVVEPFAG